MHDLVAHFSAQLHRAMDIARAAVIAPPAVEIRHVLITGLGGSGIGGTIVSEWMRDRLKVPVTVSKDYTIPAFVNKHTLMIACSYSGNTEETLSSLGMGHSAGAQIVCITSGGKVAEIAKAKGLDLVLIDGGKPPRSTIGYALVQLLFVLYYKGLTDNFFEQELVAAATLLEKEQEEMIAAAKTTAELLQDKITVIYCESKMEGIAVRFRQQIEENAKMLAWHHVVPELNHNELVGWRSAHPELAVVFLRNETDYSRNQRRMEFVSEVVSEHAGEVLELWSKGESVIERSLYLIHLTDWVTCFMSDHSGFDSMEVKVIDRLKESLSAVPLEG
jgi:glucose/mannose-6-phosphate isomerase